MKQSQLQSEKLLSFISLYIYIYIWSIHPLCTLTYPCRVAIRLVSMEQWLCERLGTPWWSWQKAIQDNTTTSYNFGQENPHIHDKNLEIPCRRASGQDLNLHLLIARQSACMQPLVILLSQHLFRSWGTNPKEDASHEAHGTGMLCMMRTSSWSVYHVGNTSAISLLSEA